MQRKKMALLYLDSSIAPFTASMYRSAVTYLSQVSLTHLFSPISEASTVCKSGIAFQVCA